MCPDRRRASRTLAKAQVSVKIGVRINIQVHVLSFRVHMWVFGVQAVLFKDLNVRCVTSIRVKQLNQNIDFKSA